MTCCCPHCPGISHDVVCRAQMPTDACCDDSPCEPAPTFAVCKACDGKGTREKLVHVIPAGRMGHAPFVKTHHKIGKTQFTTISNIRTEMEHIIVSCQKCGGTGKFEVTLA